MTHELISALRPTTLAAIMIDVENMGTGATPELIQFAYQCGLALASIVGDDVAVAMLDHEAGALEVKG